MTNDREQIEEYLEEKDEEEGEGEHEHL